MNVYLQIIIYIIVVVCFYLTTITFFEDKIINKKYFVLDNEDKQNIEIWIVTKNIEKMKKDKIKSIIEKGEYNSIYDITTNFYIKNKDVDN